jgi:hypothetical protein
MAAPVPQNISADLNVNGCNITLEGEDGNYHGGRYARRCGGGIWLVQLFLHVEREKGKRRGMVVGGKDIAMRVASCVGGLARMERRIVLKMKTVCRGRLLVPAGREILRNVSWLDLRTVLEMS